MIDLNSLPKELQEKLSRADTLLAESAAAEKQGNRQLALVKAELGLRIADEIAQQSPELGTLLLGGTMGHRGFEIDECEIRNLVVQYEGKFLGLSMGTRFKPVTETRSLKKQFKFI